MFAKVKPAMSIDYCMMDSFVVVTPYDVNTLEAVCAVLEAIIVDPGFNPPTGILFDARHTTYGPPTEELESLSEWLAKRDALRLSRWAIVAEIDTLLYGLTRMFCCLAESLGIQAEPFSEFAKAREWLLSEHGDDFNGTCAPRRAFTRVCEVS